MELGNSLYNRVAQGQYPSVECWSGWKAGSDQGVCYKLNPSGGPADWPTAFNCCQSIGGKLLAYDYTYDAQNVLGTSASLYTDLHYSGSAWVDADGPVGTPNWVTSDPQTFVPALSCATADSTGTSGSQTYDGLDCATANDYVCQYGFPFSSNIDFYDQRGSSYFIASNPSDNYGPASVSPGTGKVDIYWTRTQNQIYDSLWDNTVVTNHFTLYGYVQQEGFGRSISYLQDQVTKHQLFVGALPPSKAPVACNVPFELNQGKVYIYDGEFTKWTANQILLPPAEFNEQNFYAKTIDSDKAHLHTLIVGCYGCNYTTNSGAVFVYETDPTTKSWSQSQYLTPSSGNLNLGKERVRIHDNLIAADSGSKVLLWTKSQDQKNIASISNSLIKTEDAKPQPLRWSQQQALTALTYTFTNFDIFDETIILSSTAVPVSSFVNVGAVFVLYPNTPEFGIVAKKPQPLQWSVHQILYPPTPAANVKFGNDVSIAANRMVVTSGSSTVYVYARRTRSGFWSLQQTFAQGSTVLQTVLEGSTIYSLVNTLGNALEVYDQARGWDCLVVSIEDHFGDGWDDALLTVRTPAGPTKDEFHPRCDLENPFQFRYCPASNDHEGIYSFSIPDAVKSKYYWEIVWRVFVESTGEWIVGNWDTIMDFEWDKSSGSFKTRKITKPLSNNVTCESCKSRPTQKPSPILLRTRHLKDNDNHGGTVSPTISPAPTIAVSAGTVWQYFTVSTTGVDWFVDSHKSTSYYISDIKGHRLLSVGTFCSISAGTSKLCWEDLPDGEYVLRIGGALNPYSSQHSIKWCKSINPIPAKTQVVVKITDGDCQALSYLTRNQVCSSDLDFDTIVEVELFLLGITSQLTSSDIQQIAKAFNSIFKGFTSASIKSSILTSDGLDIVINAHLNNHASGYDLTDPTVVTQIESDMKIMFQNSERDIWAAMISTDGKSLLHSVSQVSFVSLNFVGTDSPPLTLNQIADEVVTFYPEIVVNKSETVSTLYSITGYIFVALSLILVTVFMAVRKATNNNIVTYSPIDIESKLTNENVNKNDNYSGNVSDADGYESENKEIQEKEVKNNKSSKKSTKKSKKKISSTSKGDNDINRVFAKDLPLQKLKELANAEDEYLSITSK